MIDPAPLPPRGTILLLALIAALGSLATQLLIPALPQLTHQLRSSAADAQLVISIYLIGLGTGQLLAGPLADRIGRKPVLLIGLALYSLASLAAALAPTMPLLLAARLLQALGGSAGVVLSRVLVGDLYPAQQATAKQATLMSVILISPALAPVLGGLLSEAAGWRSLFYVLAAAGIAGALISARLLPETRAISSDSKAISYGSALAQLSRNSAFLRPAISIIGGTAALYMFLGISPFLLAAEHGLRPREVGLCLMLIAGTSIVGTFLVAPIERRGDAMLTGALLTFIASVLLTLFALTSWHSLTAFLLPTILLGLGAGICGPAGIARVIAAGKGMEGTAASLAGASQMLFSALAAAMLGRFAPVGQAGLGLALVFATGIALLACGAFARTSKSGASQA
jgi:MFS transporter, DHA1 family, multidrug resistance protein